MLMRLYALWLSCLAMPATAEVYARLDDRGRLEVRSIRKDASFLRFAPGQARDQRTPAVSKRQPDPGLARLVAITALRQGVDARLLHAVVQVESAYNPHAVSAKGARGLMQLLPQTGREHAAADLFDPAQNLRAGAAHLRGLIERFEGNLVLALAAYNAGEATVRRYGNRVPPYRETRHYVKQVLAQYQGGRFYLDTADLTTMIGEITKQDG